MVSLVKIDDIAQENNLSKSLVNKRRELISNAKGIKKYSENQKDLKNLENFLNNTFFPENSNDSAKENLEKINDFVKQSYEAVQHKILKDFSITDLYYKIDDLPGKIEDKIINFSERKTICLQDMENVKKQVEAFINNLNSENNLKEVIKKAEELQQKIEIVEKKIEKELSGIKISNDKNKKNKRIKIATVDQKIEKGDKSLRDSVNEMYSLYNALANYQLTTKDYGDILEYALGALNNEINKLIPEFVNEFIKQDFGGQRITENISFFNPSHEENFFKKLQAIKTGENGSSISFNYSKNINPYTERQLKMDVELTLPKQENISTSNTFRISAKNWMTKSGRDFGDSNLLYMLIRSINEDYTQKYGYIISYNNNKNKEILKQAHNLAKIAIVLDLLMGFSQKSGYTDTLVMLDRKKREFQVESIRNIIWLINRRIDNFTIKDYEEDNLFSQACTIRQAILKDLKENKSENLQSALYRYFSNINISLRYSDLSDYLKIKKLFDIK